MTDRKTKDAARVYRAICSVLDEKKRTYEKNKKELSVCFQKNCDDIEASFEMRVDTERQLVTLTAMLPFCMSEEKRAEGVLATCKASCGMTIGHFNYDATDGSLSFRITESFVDCTIDQGVFDEMIICASAMIAEYGGKFLALDKGTADLSVFDEL